MFTKGRKLMILGVLVVWGISFGEVPPWPQYQHDPQHTGRSQYPGPDNPTLEWKKELTTNCKIVVGTGNRVYIGSDKLYALTQNGAEKWSRYFGGSIYTPIIGSDGLIYGATWDGWFFCVRDDETEGTVIYKNKIGNYLFAPALSPDGNTICLGSGDGNLYFIERADGNIKGSFTTSSSASSFTIPAFGTTNQVYFGVGTPNTLYALTSDGTFLWKATFTYTICDFSVGKDGLFTPECGNLYALDIGDGQQMWKKSGVFAFSPAIAFDGTLYVPSTYYLGTNSLYALDPATGSIKWQYPEGGNLGGKSCCPPIIDSNGNIYFGVGNSSATGTKSIYCLNKDGEFIFRFDTADYFWGFSSLAIGSDSILYAGTDYQWVYAIGKAPSSYYLSGYIKDTQGSATQGVTVTLYAQSTSSAATTNSSGYYEFTNLTIGLEYTLLPSKSGYIFSPCNYLYPALSESKDNQDFTAKALSGAYNDLGDEDDFGTDSDISLGYGAWWDWPWYEEGEGNDGQFWWCTTPVEPAGKTTSRAIKYRHMGYIDVKADIFPLDENKRPETPLYLTIRYKDDIRAPNSMGIGLNDPGARLYSYNGNTPILQDYIGGSFDHNWKTTQFKIATNTIMAIDTNDKENIFRFRIGDYYSDYVLGELPIDKVKLSTGSDTPEFEEDKAGFWPQSRDSNFSNLKETAEYIPGKGAFFPYGMGCGPSFIYDQGTGPKDSYQIMEDNNLNCGVLGGQWYLNWYSFWKEYPGLYTWDDPGVYVEAGFDEHLKMAKAHNLKIIPDFYEDTRSGQIADRHGSEEDCLDYLEQVMYDHRDNPNLLFWWLKDEWDHEYATFGSPHLFIHQVSQRQRLADPNRPGFLVGMGFMGLTEWAIMGEDADALCTDSYPSDSKSYEKGLARQAEKLDNIRQAVGSTRPFLLMPEIYFMKMDDGVTRTYKKEEVLSQVYLALCHGAVGILFQRFYHPADPQWDQYGGMQSCWDGLKQGGYELLKAEDKLADVILPPSVILDIMADMGIATTTTQKMHCIYKQKQNGDKYLITINAGSITQTGTWKLSDMGIGTKTLTVLFETRTVTAINGSFIDTYKPYERHVYKITSAPKPNITLKKTSDKKYVSPGGTVTYTITYSNEGNGTATDVVIIEVLPENCGLRIANLKR